MKVKKVMKSKNILHGGDIQSASRLFGVPIEQWIDLSTGINPESYPVQQLDPSSFQQLPYLKSEFIQAAKEYYCGLDNRKCRAQISELLAVSGSQAVIQLLPECLPSLPVLLPDPGYQEHRLQWQRSGVSITDYPALELDAATEFINQALHKNKQQHLVIINPNNPSGLQFSPTQLQSWAKRLADGAYLIIDEAFMDMQPENSVLGQHFEPNMVVLRSFGKFFGLAGLRLGFVFANYLIIEKLQQGLGLWAINGPAQTIATLAFQDESWQQQARIDIAGAAKRNQALFRPLFTRLSDENKSGSHKEIHEALFSSYWLPIGQAEKLSNFFAKRGILLRHMPFNDKFELLRIGQLNPNNKENIARVASAVSDYVTIHLS